MGVRSRADRPMLPGWNNVGSALVHDHNAALEQRKCRRELPACFQRSHSWHACRGGEGGLSWTNTQCAPQWNSAPLQSKATEETDDLAALSRRLTDNLLAGYDRDHLLRRTTWRHSLRLAGLEADKLQVKVSGDRIIIDGLLKVDTPSVRYHMKTNRVCIPPPRVNLKKLRVFITDSDLLSFEAPVMDKRNDITIKVIPPTEDQCSERSPSDAEVWTNQTDVE